MSKPQGILRPLGLALVLAIGFGAVLALAAEWGIKIWEGLRRQNRVSEGLVVRADGTPLIQRNTYDEYQTVTFRELEDGREVPRPKDNSLVGASLAIPRRDRLMFPLIANARVRPFADGQGPPNLWYFVHDGARDGRGYFVGYDSRTKLCVGFIGRDGFRPDQPPAEQWFPMDGAKLASGTAFSRFEMIGYWYGVYYGRENGEEFPAWKVEMISGAELLEVDLRKRSVRALMESADLVAVGVLETAAKSKAAGEEARPPRRPEKLAVRTTDRVLLFDATGKQYSAFPVPEEFRDRSIVLYELDAGTALVTASRLLPDRSRREELLWIDASGRVLGREGVPLGEGNAHYDQIEAWKAALVVSAPVVLAFLAMVPVPSDYLAQGLEPDYPAALARSLAAFWPALLGASLLAAALAWHCCRRHRRYYQPASGVWFVFVLLTGVPGLVAYLFHRGWPVLEKCPACGHNIPRDREACAKCGVAFPAPEPKGCEVFA
ncbi:MAG: hypothetical protein ABSG86_24900 [Thermoguttaceae bacterium]|jgi:hypothetical protein